MKKVLFVLLAVLMIFAMVSCSASGISEEEAAARTQEKVNEVEETYKEFVRYKYALSCIGGVCAKGSVDADDVGRFYEAFFGGEKQIVKISHQSTNISVTQGTASGKYTKDDESDATFKNFKFNVSKYQILNRKDDTVIKNVTEGEELTISEGYYKIELSNVSGDDNYTRTDSIGITIDGKEYSVSYSYNIAGREKTYVSASVNGKTVSANLLIAEDLVDYEDFLPYLG